LTLVANDGRVIASIEGMRFQRVDEGAAAGPITESVYEWQWDDASRPEMASPGFADPALVVNAIETEIARLREEFESSQFYADIEKRMTAACVAWIARAFRTLGWQGSLPELRAPGAAARLGVDSRHWRMFDRFVDILAQHSHPGDDPEEIV